MLSLRIAFALPGVSAVVALAACGSSSTVTHTTTASPPATTSQTRSVAAPATTSESHAALIAHLDVICKSGNGAIKAIDKEATTSAAEGELLEKGLDVYRAAVPRLERLKPSPSDRSNLSQYVAAIKRQEGALVRLTAAVRAGETEQVARLESLIETYSKERVTDAINLGAEDCGR